MSNDYFHFEAAQTPKGGHALNEKVTAVYKLAGYIEKRYKNRADGSAMPYWTYIEDGKDIGLVNYESAEAMMLHFKSKPIRLVEEKIIGETRRLFIGLLKWKGGTVDQESVLQMVASRFKNFTATESTGYYKGKALPTLVIEIAGPGVPPIEALAADLAVAFDQEAVGVEAGGVYKRVFGAKAQRDKMLVEEDRKKLNNFTSELSSGKSFGEMDAETQAWWLNRY